MNILINTASTHKGGSVQVARSFIEECQNYKEHNYYVILGKALSKIVEYEDYPENFSFYCIGYRPATRVFSYKSREKFFRDIENKIKPDVVFTTTGPAYWRPEAPHLVAYNLPHYIYRDSPYFSQIPYYQRFKWNLKGRVLKYFFQREADAYVVQTNDVNKRLKQWLETNRVYTVSNTFSSYYDNPTNIANKLPKKGNNEFRFLSLTAWYPHKNLGIIPKILAVLPESLKDRVRFVLTLPDKDFRTNFPAELEDHILNIGPVEPDEGPALYQECDALFLPTLLECFSANYAEAMKMEKPIITSELGFAHTVCGEAALYVDPMNPNDIAEKMTELINNPHLKEKLIRNGIRQQETFVTAKERAEQYLDICKELVDEKRR